jgi:hypothetical protein
VGKATRRVSGKREGCEGQVKRGKSGSEGGRGEGRWSSYKFQYIRALSTNLFFNRHNLIEQKS